MRDGEIERAGCKVGRFAILLRKMKKLKSNTISCYINPTLALYAFIVLTICGIDTHQYIYDIILNKPVVLAIFLFMGNSVVMT